MENRPTKRAAAAHEQAKTSGHPSADQRAQQGSLSEGRKPKVNEIDPDAPARSLFDDQHDAVEPNEPA